MDFYKNNYFQSKSFKELNKNIFNYEIIDLPENNFFIIRNKNNLEKKIILFSKIDLGTEFRGILEFIGQSVNLNSLNFENKFIKFLDDTQKIIKKIKPGIIIFRSFEVETDEQFLLISKLFKNYGYLCRPWNSLIIDINNLNKDLLISNYNTRREIKLITKLNIEIEEINNFNQYETFMNFFFKTMRHQNYPNKDKYFKLEAWNNLSLNHNFFILKIDGIPYSIFSVRIYKDRAYWCMVGRIRNFKYSLHAYAIDFLFDYLKKKNVSFLDLAGFNPKPRNKKEEGIKYFKQKFKGNIINQPSFILDNTFLIKNARSLINFFKKNKSFADEPIF